MSRQRIHVLNLKKMMGLIHHVSDVYMYRMLMAVSHCNDLNRQTWWLV